jgi:hypothetical protein
VAEIHEVAAEALESSEHSRFTSRIALLVAITATAMALCHIKDGNLVLKMSEMQSKSVDTWALYQAKSTKQHIAEAALDQVKLQEAVLRAQGTPVPSPLADAEARYGSEDARYDKEKADVKEQAEGYTASYERLTEQHDEFDFAEACFTVAIALYGVAALARKQSLATVAVVFSLLGLAFGVAGFTGLSLHPDWLARILG